MVGGAEVAAFFMIVVFFTISKVGADCDVSNNNKEKMESGCDEVMLCAFFPSGNDFGCFLHRQVH